MNQVFSSAESCLERRALIAALRKLRAGDFTVRLPEDDPSCDSEIAALFKR